MADRVRMNTLSLATVKADSLRLFSAAMACRVASGSHSVSGMTAAGLPANALPANRPNTT